VSTFRDLFGDDPAVTGDAPGRANLIGEHTDYSGGYVLPVTIPQRTRVELRRRGEDVARVHSVQLGKTESYRVGAESPRHDWLDYLQGLTALARPLALGGFDARVDSTVPPGSGLSSSAALEVATLRALRKAFGWELDDLQLALLAQRAEVEFVGAPVGVMDPMASSLGSEGAALFIDTRSFQTVRVPLPPGLAIAVVHSGIAHGHAGGEYRVRRRECEEATRALAAVLAGREDEASRLTLGDWCWARGVELAVEHNLPFKLHTGHHAGTGQMPIDWVRAGNLCPLLARYPEARFVLMHTSYPYSDELVSIAKHYPNVCVDLCWAWSIDPYSSADFVRRFLHTVPSNKLFAFGGDTFWPTAAVAYSIQARRGLQRALEAEIAEGDLTEPEAITIARRLMHDNQYACFDIEGTRAAIRTQLQPAGVA